MSKEKKEHGAGIVIGGDPVVPALPSAGFGGMFDGLVTKLLGSVKFDWKKIDPKELKLAVSSMGDGVNGFTQHTGKAFKPAIDVVLNADDLAIDKIIQAEVAGMNYLVQMVNTEIDTMWPTGGLTFNAEAPMTGDDVQNYLDMLTATEKAEGHSFPQFNARSVELMKANPEVIRLLKKTTRARQLKAVTDDTFMQKVIDFLTKYGPILAQVFSIPAGRLAGRVMWKADSTNSPGMLPKASTRRSTSKCFSLAQARNSAIWSKLSGVANSTRFLTASGIRAV